MTDFIERLTLLIDVNAQGAVTALKGFGQTATSDLAKVEGGAGVSGANAGNNFSNAFGKTALAGFAALQAATAGLAVGGFLKGAVEDAVTLARAEAALGVQVEAVGAQTGVTTGSLDRLATSVQKNDVIFSGTVKSAESLLLTFREVQNVAGKGNDIFNRTIGVAGALSNVFGRDLTSVTLQLGRALENPLTGMQALQRSGVTLSQQLRTQIRDFANQGDLLDAQKVLLDELEKRYTKAGAAIAKADPFQQFGVSFLAFKTQVGQDFLPLASHILDTASNMVDEFSHLPGPIRASAEALVALSAVALPLLAVQRVLATINTFSGAASTISAGSAGASTGGSSAVATAAKEQTVAATEAAGAMETLGTASQTAGIEALNAADAVAQLNVQFDLLAGAGTVDAALKSVEGDFALIKAEAAAVAEELGVVNAMLAETGTVDSALIASSAGASGALAAQTTEVTTLAEETSGLSFSLAALGPIALGAFAGFTIGNAIVTTTHHSFQQVTSDLDGFISRVEKFQGSNFFDRLFHPRGTSQTINDIKTINDELTHTLDTQGVQAASSEFESLQSKFKDVSGINAFNAATADFRINLDAAAAAEQAAIRNTNDLATAFSALSDQFGPALSGIAAVDKVTADFQAVRDAQANLAHDRRTAAGTSREAIAADQAEADALHGLANAHDSVDQAQQRVTDSINAVSDAQNRLTDSIHNLQEAQQNLADFDSARGQRERALQRDIINRRVVTTASGEEQKQLDLLQNTDQNNQKQRQLQDQVASAQRGVADATKALASATRAVSDAQRAESQATDGIAAANRRLQDAIFARHKLAVDAAKAEISDQVAIDSAWQNVITDVKAAADNTATANGQMRTWLNLFKTLGQNVDGPIKSILNSFYKDLIEKQKHFNAEVKANPLLHNAFETPAQAGANQGGTTGVVSGLGTIPGPIYPKGTGTPYGGTPPELRSGSARTGSSVTINQTNNFSKTSAPSTADLEYANRQLGWKLARSGRS